MDGEQLIKCLVASVDKKSDATSKNVSISRDVIGECIDHIDWLEKGINEWRSEATRFMKLYSMDRAKSSIAIKYLQELLNTRKTATQAWEIEKAAREWLDSIGE